jgi:dTDP-4-dehydrorhamnose 3,5-epimerase
MFFKETKLKGAYIIELEPAADERGYFARTYCSEEFERHGLNPRVAQCNVSYNQRKGTLRGLHYQIVPFSEAKLVTCIAGSIYDVIVDVRPDSPTYCGWFAVKLSARHPRSMLYIPENFAHGFQTLEDDTEVFYQMSESYHPDSARGLRWNDPTFNIHWPQDRHIISAKDRSFPDFVR